MRQSMKDLGRQIARHHAEAMLQDPRLASREPDPDLVDVVADAIFTWITSAKATGLAVEYYRGILGQVSARLGDTEETHFANVPMLVDMLVTRNRDLAAELVRRENIESRDSAYRKPTA